MRVRSRIVPVALLAACLAPLACVAMPPEIKQVFAPPAPDEKSHFRFAAGAPLSTGDPACAAPPPEATSTPSSAPRDAASPPAPDAPPAAPAPSAEPAAPASGGAL